MLDHVQPVPTQAEVGLRLIPRRLTPDDVPAVLDLQEAVLRGLDDASSHFLKRRTPDYVEGILSNGIGIGLFADDHRLIAQALLRRQNKTHHEHNCNVNNYLLHVAPHAAPTPTELLAIVRNQEWGVIGTLLVRPEPTWLRHGLGRSAVMHIIEAYRTAGGTHLFSSMALENSVSRRIFASLGFKDLAEAVDPRDGWRCVIMRHNEPIGQPTRTA